MIAFVKWCVALAVACYQPRALVGDGNVTGQDAGADATTDAAIDGVTSDADAATCALRTWVLFDGGDPTQETTQPPDGIKDWVGSGFNISQVANGIWDAPSAEA